MSAWQPIETAPKDRTDIVGFQRYYSEPWSYTMHWNGIQWYTGFGDLQPPVKPTHWMPMPDWPVTDGEIK
jgi:hypothetical protein